MTIQQFIAAQPETIQQLLTILRTWIRDLGPHVEEKMQSKVPYYYFYGHLCTLSLARDGVEFSFAKGYELDDESKVLESKGRKHVKSITFYSVAEAEEHEEEMRRLLNRAAILNEYHFKRKQKKHG